ncbi:MAG: beta-N-acetylhexosaminidase [Xanthomonadales bacterium]|nr:beta-N-acetylhexosaminidase [Xanthomonadales bacterium]
MLIIGIQGHELADEERDWIAHPSVSGVILFTRNFDSPEQLDALCRSVRDACPRPLLLCVDQEGGRVQRFRHGCSTLPALADLAAAEAPLDVARAHGWLMASEMLAMGMDLSFAPVLDLGRGNLAIGNRALAEGPEAVIPLATAYLAGMREAGMAATLKHFPGHGSVREDTHFDAAVDPRDWDVLWREDLRPFVAGLAAGAEAVMMAHVSYPKVDPLPAGYSPHWIRSVLRERLGFDGVVISDDIGMAAAESAGGVAGRLTAHFDAGCDLVLVCPPALVAESLDAMPAGSIADPAVIERLRPRARPTWPDLGVSATYRMAAARLQPLPGWNGVLG